MNNNKFYFDINFINPYRLSFFIRDYQHFSCLFINVNILLIESIVYLKKNLLLVNFKRKITDGICHYKCVKTLQN